METCSHCGGTLPSDATFCPSCGRRTDAPVTRDVPIDVQHAMPRFFGVAPPVFVFGATVVLLLLGLVLLASGAVVAGAVAVVLALALLPAFVAGARRWPDSPIARLGVSAADRVRGEAGAAAESISAWSRASREVARLRKEQFALRRERDAKIRELGAAYYADEPRAAELRAEARALDERRAENERTLQRTVAGARRRARKGRAAVVSTEVIQPEQNPLAGVAEPDAAVADEPLARETEEPGREPESETAPAPKPAQRRQTRSR